MKLDLVELDNMIREYQAQVADIPTHIEFGWEAWEELKKLAVAGREDPRMAVTRAGHLNLPAAFGTPVHVLYCLAPQTVMVRGRH